MMRRPPTTIRGRVSRQRKYLRRLETPDLPARDRQSLTVAWLQLEVANLTDLISASASLQLAQLAARSAK